METKDGLRKFASSLAKLLLDKKNDNPSITALRDGLTEESKQTLKAWCKQKI